MLNGLSLAQIVFFAFFCSLTIVLILVVRNIARLGREEEERRRRQGRDKP